MLRALLLFFFLSSVSNAFSAPADELTRGLGETDHSRMEMRFKVTFFRIDIADVTALLAPEVAADLGALVEEGKKTDEVEALIRTILLDSDRVLNTMTFCRDADFGRFLKGATRSLQGAVDAKIITDEEFETLSSGIRADFSPLEVRGVKEGDAVHYLIAGSDLRTVVISAEGEVLLDLVRTGEIYTRGSKGSFFGKKSQFSEKLIESLFKSD